MTGRPRLEFHQLWVPGTDGPGVILTLHKVDNRSFAQRISITRRTPEPAAFRHSGRLDFVATRAQLYDFVGELDERAGLMTDTTPRGDDLRGLIG
jgi:hypothetical protein